MRDRDRLEERLKEGWRLRTPRPSPEETTDMNQLIRQAVRRRRPRPEDTERAEDGKDSGK